MQRRQLALLQRSRLLRGRKDQTSYGQLHRSWQRTRCRLQSEPTEGFRPLAAESIQREQRLSFGLPLGHTLSEEFACIDLSSTRRFNREGRSRQFRAGACTSTYL